MNKPDSQKYLFAVLALTDREEKNLTEWLKENNLFKSGLDANSQHHSYATYLGEYAINEICKRTGIKRTFNKDKFWNRRIARNASPDIKKEANEECDKLFRAAAKKIVDEIDINGNTDDISDDFGRSLRNSFYALKEKYN